ncbi:MAG: toll/interleukin-1 receptor domain-containing protein [Pedobacter sp.]|nr:MAG: toll/interleukin-1 receptor domain-containing protein [Pedobacter sp.]
MKKDLFISHASEDKDSFVRPLANLLKQYGVNVWYDEFELRIGSSVSRSIDKGISGSHFGLIVLSTSFFSKNWTEYELKSLISFEVDKGDFLLPIWKDVKREEVRDFSPYLADKFALLCDMGIEALALKIIETVKPDLFSEIHKKLAVEEALKSKEIKMIKASELTHGPVRNLILSESIISRIRLIRSSLWLGYQRSMEIWIDGFRRELHVESEVLFWEHVSSCFLELITQLKAEDAHIGDKTEIYNDLFKLVFSILQAGGAGKFGDKFTEEFVSTAIEICHSTFPVYDIEETNPFDNRS